MNHLNETDQSNACVDHHDNDNGTVSDGTGATKPTTENDKELANLNSTQCTTSAINVDDILRDIVGGAGLWQLLLAILILFSCPSTPTYPVFVNSMPTYRCKLDSKIETEIKRSNLSLVEVAKLIGPWNDEAEASQHAGKQYSNGCYRYNWNCTNLNCLQSQKHVESRKSNKSLTTVLISCDRGYVYELDTTQKYPGSVIIEFNTVCEKDWLVPFGSSIYFFGQMIGLLMAGWLADRYGRKLVAIIYSFIEIIFAVCTSLAPNYSVYVISRGFIGAANMGKVCVLNVLMMEICLAKYRSLFAALLALGYNCILRSMNSLEAYFIPNWRWLNCAVMLPSVLVVFYFFIAESPRWLLSQNRINEALKSLKFGYYLNHFFDKNYNPDLFDNYTRTNYDVTYGLTKQSQQPYKNQKNNHSNNKLISKHFVSKFFKSLILPFQTVYLAKITLLSTLLFSGQVMIFFGLLLFTRVMKGNVYMVSLFNAIASLPGILISTLSYRFVSSRRIPLIVVKILAFLTLLIGGSYTYFAQPKSDLVLVITSNVALVFISSGVFMLYVYVPELYPSLIRSQGFGTATGLARVGSMLCSFVNQLDFYIGHGFPMFVYAGTLVIQICIMFIIPDTNGENLQDRVIQVGENN